MPIKHVHKSLVNINEKTSILFVELISILVNTIMYLNYDFDFIFFYISTRYDRELVK